MKISIADSIRQVDASAWDALAGGWFYAGYAWTVYQEQDKHSIARYVQVTSGDRVVAAAAVHLVEQEWSELYDTAVLFPDLDDGGRGGRPVVLAGGRRGNSSRLLVDRSHPEAEAALRELVGAVNEIAAKESDGRAWWLYLSDEDTAYLTEHVPATSPRIMAADCAIELPGTTFDDYLAGLSRNQRRQVRVDRRAFQGAGYTTDAVDFRESWDQFAPLVARHERKHGHDVDDEFIGELMRLQAECCGEFGTIQACWADKEMRAGGLAFTTSTMIAGRAFGFDHPRPSASEYFELFYYRPIEQAYLAGVRLLHLGIGTLAAKARRGAQVRPLWGLATGQFKETLPPLAARHNQEAWNRFRDELVLTPDALTSTFLHRGI
ncbi:peptidogalycan biosysnthesis protein [Streptomyces sp. NBC_01017]|uniref:peptidogalycan biosysnthesis protein n=1 Tax=Streptomyces sp. NBC_01017 TaxID=2903721 RepID=UPI0038691042|nr:peptidogalycan biosysnthesis protein [Streptomyces sp. NBC_01017]